jgi:hypothetical protein
MAMEYYPNYQMYAYGSFNGHFNPYAAHGGPDPWRAAHAQARNVLMNHNNMTKPTESKPRLAKEEVERLEAEFQKNNKPNSSVKKGLAEEMRVDIARINVLTTSLRLLGRP